MILMYFLDEDLEGRPVLGRVLVTRLDSGDYLDDADVYWDASELFASPEAAIDAERDRLREKIHDFLWYDQQLSCLLTRTSAS